MMACTVCALCWKASHCIACVTASTTMVRLEVVTVWAPLFSCTVLPTCLTMYPQSDQCSGEGVRGGGGSTWVSSCYKQRNKQIALACVRSFTHRFVSNMVKRWTTLTSSFITVWMTLTFIQDHSCMRKQTLLYSFSRKFSNWFLLNAVKNTAKACWSVAARAEFISCD